jgi:hypothetical protein
MVLVWVGAAVVGWLVLEVLLRILEQLGLIHWRRRRPKRSGATLAPLAGMFDPTAQYLQDAQEERVTEEAASPDGSGKNRRLDTLQAAPPPIRMPGAAEAKRPARTDDDG